MASSAGQQLVAGRIPGEQIAETTATSDSSNFTTTETTVISVTAPLVDGRTYKIEADVGWQSSVSADRMRMRIREDNSSGTVLSETQLIISTTATTTPYTKMATARFTASATANKTFVVTGERLAGSGNVRMEADTTRASFLGVYYLSG